MSKEKNSMNVVIIGGSLSGLLYGIMLKRIGHNVRILEQSSTSTRAGQAAGMGTGPRGKEYFETYDLCSGTYAVPCPGFQYLDALGALQRFSKWGLNLTSWDTLYCRLRANYDGLRSEQCPEPPAASLTDGNTHYDLNKRVFSTEYSDNVVTVKAEDLSTGETVDYKADLVLVADGSHSAVRRTLIPGSESTYSGYLAWRGTVHESQVTQETRDLFGTKFNVFLMKYGYIVGYIMPGENGDLTVGNRDFNYVWYYNCPANSTEYTQTMTDKYDHLHTNSMPATHLRPQTWENLKAHASSVLNPPFLELVQKTSNPFISSVRDYVAPQLTFYDGKLLLVGESATIYRPHTGVNFNQNALNCMQLREVLEGKKTLQQWEDDVLKTQETTRTMAIVYGEYYQSGLLSSRFWVATGLFVYAMAVSRLSRLRGLT